MDQNAATRLEPIVIFLHLKLKWPAAIVASQFLSILHKFSLFSFMPQICMTTRCVLLRYSALVGSKTPRVSDIK